MILQIKHNRYHESSLTTKSVPELLKGFLPDIHQDDLEVKNLIMERSRYEKYGCRVIGLYRCIIYQLRKQGIKELTAEENDSLIDAGGELSDCWVDDTKNPVYDILAAPQYVERINQRFSTTLTYHIYKQNELGEKLFFEKLCYHLRQDVPVVIKMPGLFGGFHFVNVIGSLQHENGKGYFLLKETYRRYKGYEGKWCESRQPLYAEAVE